MPNVPNVPGVPPLASYSQNTIVLLFEDIVAAILGLFAPQWGIYLDGLPVLFYDNEISFGFAQDWKVSTYPIEGGSFASYDKVQIPSEIRCRFSAGLDVTNRQEMLRSIDDVMSTTLLYDVVTPEVVYTGFNFVHRSYDREAEKAGLVVVDVFLMEILESVTAQFQSTQSPVNAGQVGIGNVPATATDPMIQSTVQSEGWN